ncbi:AAA family ATPase [Shewanella alkalitolerans]|uniref:DEAD/DEAH box helicase n=1 Tax=Shewanella alkalitolerans TaxID=2864209 RepID=UPI001C65F0D9|nr:AAA domain-containing protein [Shewanella alkalitolerans]QYJ96946.1 AAA family ATPase [Shewanella alkalitolerans]
MQGILSYYKQCFAHDSAEINLWSCHKLAEQDQLLLQGEDELASGFLPRLPLPHTLASALMNRSALYLRERVLLHCSLFFSGTIELNGERRKVVTPLLYRECQIQADGDEIFLQASESLTGQNPFTINEALLEKLVVEGHSLTQDLRDNPTDVSGWIAWLRAGQADVDATQLLHFPKLIDEAIFEGLRRKHKGFLVSRSQLVLAERSLASRGILHELDLLMATTELSPPLQALFAEQQPSLQSKRQITTQQDCLPGLLSNAQMQALDIAANHTLGQISGPPGTGKSYTIATIAAEQILRGKSVLIAAHTDVAVDVIADKLQQQFQLGSSLIRAGSPQFIKQLKSQVDDMLNGIHPVANKKVTDIALQKAYKQLEIVTRQQAKLEQSFTRHCKRAIGRGQKLARLEQQKSRWRLPCYNWFYRGGIRRFSRQWEVLDSLNGLIAQKEKLSLEYLQLATSHRQSRLLQNKRSSLVNFAKAIRARQSAKQLEAFYNTDFSALQQTFPIWLSSLANLHRVLPMQQEMFDLVIIDEATQANIAECLPALQRAKAALVVGDSKQLRHFSFLSREKQASIQTQLGIAPDRRGLLSYRDASMLDLVSGSLSAQAQVAFLDEHFRSKPELIQFSNQAFYQNALKVMQHRPCTSSGHLHRVQVNGERDAKGVNLLEAEALMDKLSQLIEEQADALVPSSIGVLSCFRHQTEYLSKQIMTRFSLAQIERHQLRIATPFGFQGEERDIMLLSFSVTAQDSRAAAYLNRADMFNVAITRAKQAQWLFLSLDETALPNNNLLAKYLTSATQFEAKHNYVDALDEFGQAVTQALEAKGITVWRAYHMAGLELDILCRHGDQYLAIDLIGYPGPWEDFFEINLYKLLQRAGVSLMPLSYGLWSQQQALCIDYICKQFGIAPTLDVA